MIQGSTGPVKDTFLTLWITGFDGRLSASHRLVPVTLVSVGLIAMAALLVVGHRIATTIADRKADHASATARAALVRDLCTAQRLLNLRRASDGSGIEAVVKRSVKELLAAHKATRAAADDLRVAATAIGPALTTLTSATDGTRLSAVAAGTASQQPVRLRLGPPRPWLSRVVVCSDRTQQHGRALRWRQASPGWSPSPCCRSHPHCAEIPTR
jgi:hypothetical protein